MTPLPSAGGPFLKYKKLGAYHWHAHTRSVFRYDAFTAARYQAVLDNAALAPGECVVDVGCGDGALAYAALRAIAGVQLIGVEPDPCGAALFRSQLAQHGYEVPLVADLACIESSSTDVVICAEVLEHVDNPVDLLQACRRVLRPGGRLILSTPVRTSESPFDPEHRREFFSSELRKLVRPCFEVKKHVDVISHFAVELYFWRPVCSRVPLPRLVMNALAVWCGWNPLLAVSGMKRLYTTQIIVAVKEK
jgi:2-polyprenyl-3-methyl-5-hydroxy-6-metoxy-1,4-benzoquinol methylase